MYSFMARLVLSGSRSLCQSCPAIALLVGIGLDQARISQRLRFTGQLFSQYRR
jgi:hypothetical protein